jgi:hypothetical protein
MQALFLSNWLFHKVLESHSMRVVAILKHPVYVGEQLAIMEGSELEFRLRTPMYFRYISEIGDCEYIENDEVIVSLVLSSTKVSSSSTRFGYVLLI